MRVLFGGMYPPPPGSLQAVETSAPLLGGAGGGLILPIIVKPTPNPSEEGNKTVGFANKKHPVNAYFHHGYSLDAIA